jgi:hypothetical protein
MTTADLAVAVLTAMAAIVGAFMEWRRDGDTRERLARLEARCDALERQP